MRDFLHRLLFMAIAPLVILFAMAAAPPVRGYLGPWSGAIERALSARLADDIYVTDFGADPTGVANSAPAIKAAEAEVCRRPQGAHILYPDGTYLFDDNTPFTAPATCSHLVSEGPSGAVSIKRGPHANEGGAWFLVMGQLGTYMSVLTFDGIDFDGNVSAGNCPLTGANATSVFKLNAPLDKVTFAHGSIKHTCGTGIVWNGENHPGLNAGPDTSGYAGTAGPIYLDSVLPNLHVGAPFSAGIMPSGHYVTAVGTGVSPALGKTVTTVTLDSPLEASLQTVTTINFGPGAVTTALWRAGATSLTIDNVSNITPGQRFIIPTAMSCLNDGARILTVVGNTITVPASDAPICDIASNSLASFGAGFSDVLFDHFALNDIGYSAHVQAGNYTFYTAGTNPSGSTSLTLQAVDVKAGAPIRYGMQPGNGFAPYYAYNGAGPALPGAIISGTTVIGSGAVANPGAEITASIVGDTLHVTALTAGTTTIAVGMPVAEPKLTYKGTGSIPYGVSIKAALAKAAGDISTWQLSQSFPSGVASETMEVGGSYTVQLSAPLQATLGPGVALPTFGPSPTGDGFGMWTGGGVWFANQRWTFEHLTTDVSWSTNLLINRIWHLVLHAVYSNNHGKQFNSAFQQGSNNLFGHSNVDVTSSDSRFFGATGTNMLMIGTKGWNSTNDTWSRSGTCGLGVINGRNIHINNWTAQNNGQAFVWPLLQDINDDPDTDYAGSCAIQVTNASNGGTTNNAFGTISDVEIGPGNGDDTQTVPTQAYVLEAISNVPSGYDRVTIDCHVTGTGYRKGFYDLPIVAPQCPLAIPPGTSPVIVVAASGTPHAMTGTAGVETNLASVPIPPALLNANSHIRITALYQFPNNANVKTPSIRLSGAAGPLTGVTYYSQSITTAGSLRVMFDVMNAGSMSAQVGAAAGTPGPGPANGVPVTGSLNTANALSVSFNGTLSVATDTITLLGYTVEVLTN